VSSTLTLKSDSSQSWKYLDEKEKKRGKNPDRERKENYVIEKSTKKSRYLRIIEDIHTERKN
jgi:hypothetical protein